MVEKVGEVLKEFSDCTVEGVLALGEVCGNEQSTLSFYNKTFVISLQQEAEPSVNRPND